jgi:arylsulfatase
VRHVVPILLLLLSAACGEASGPRPSPDVLLITIDTLRADRTEPGGHDLPTTPSMRTLAARGTVYTACVSQHPETGPSLSSVMTSRYPRETGVRENGVVLPAEFPVLAESFASAGYRTAAFVSTYLLKPHACGLDRGFSMYDHEMTRANLGHADFERPAAETAERAVRWISREPGRPFFLWVHFYEPHGVYDPGDEVARRFYRKSGRPPLDPEAVVPYQRFRNSLDPDDYEARYDGEVFLADAGAGRVLGAAGPGAVVALTADHGEGFGENGYWYRHGSLLDDAAVHVPLIFAGPGVPAGDRRAGIVRLIDVAPTLLHLAGRPPLPGARGGSLRKGEPEEPAFSEARRLGGVSDRSGIDTRYKVSARVAGRTLVLHPDSGEPDPAGAESGSELGAALRRWLLIGDRLPGRERPPDVGDAMRGLGYLRGGDGR